MSAILMDGVLEFRSAAVRRKCRLVLGCDCGWRCISWTSHRPELKLVFGADCVRDREHALSLQASFGGRLYSVAGVAEHNPFGAHLARGELAEFLREILG